MSWNPLSNTDFSFGKLEINKTDDDKNELSIIKHGLLLRVWLWYDLYHKKVVHELMQEIMSVITWVRIEMSFPC